MVGMMWYDPSKLPLEAKIATAASYYKDKYAIDPNKAVVNPAEIGVAPDGITLERDKSILPNNIWIGRDREAANAHNPN